MFWKYKKIITWTLIVVSLIVGFFFLSRILKVDSGEDKPAIYTYEGLVSYAQSLIRKYPQYDKYFVLYLPSVGLNILKLVIFSLFILLSGICILIKKFIGGKENNKLHFKAVNWTLGDILNVYILALIIHSASVFIWEDIFAENIPLEIAIEATFHALLIGFLIIAMVVMVRENKISALGFVSFPVKQFFGLIVKTAVTMVLVAGLISFLLDYEVIPEGSWVKLIRGNRLTTMGSFLVMQFLLLTIISPISEEMFFRGFLFSFLRNKIGFTASVLLVSLLFAALHFKFSSLFLFFLLFALSVSLCFVYEKTKNLTYSIVIHSGYNIFLTTGFIVDLVK